MTLDEKKLQLLAKIIKARLTKDEWQQVLNKAQEILNKR